MRFNLAILSVLAARPEQRIPLDEVSREVKRMIAAGDAATRLKRSSELGEADVFQSGWASINEAGLQITESGLALWSSLEASRAEQERIGQELGEQELGDQEHSEPQAERLAPVAAETTDATGDAVGERAGAIDRQFPRVMDEEPGDRIIASASRSTAPPELPAPAPIVLGPAFGSIRETDRNASLFARLAERLGTGMPGFARARRRRRAQDAPDRKTSSGFGMPGLAVAFLGLISVVACVAAAIALGQNSSLKSEIVTLRREFVPLRERLAKLEQDAAKREAAQQEEARDKAEAEKRAAISEQSALNLSREEIQLIREYIKAAPSVGAAAAPPVNVGDPVTGGMIPLPSPLTEKVSRLVGARFAIRNGAIIISTRNSRRVDAVLMPN
ncbi:hypothetical protein [Bradyrhizobium sp. Ce-3]|uniref:hypothetical protein n=1 Tax=Bradyrhizobium sp. Ce-3 TaxID=2913970 RepID=UPI001FBAB9A4|nr:hypothetical protein [Bradyrhizobium sp. Ce-3]GKQ49712.1 hypothetical protein BRSPCE3_05660 [Bradyrhizobium sp. Ce-3]